MAANKLTIDLSDCNKEILEKIKTEKRMPYGNTINNLIDTFGEIPKSVKKELLIFIKIQTISIICVSEHGQIFRK